MWEGGSSVGSSECLGVSTGLERCWYRHVPGCVILSQDVEGGLR